MLVGNYHRGIQRDSDVGSIDFDHRNRCAAPAQQLKRLARRVPLGLGRDGSYSGNGSGDIFLAFSTANPGAWDPTGIKQLQMLPNDRMDPLFLATVQSVEEAVVNALIGAETMVGVDDHKVIAIPHDKLREVLKKYNRLNEPRQ